MSVSIIDYKDGIKWIDVDSPSGLKARLSNFGAGIYSLELDGTPLILSLKNPDEFLTSPQYFGKTLGRVAGRIPGIVNLNNKNISLKIKEGFSYSLHAGDDTSLSYALWDVKIKEGLTKDEIIFSIVDKDGNNGFPGKATLKVIYTFFKTKANLKIDFRGKVNKESLLNLSNHMYFSFANDLDISEYKFKMNCGTYGDVDKTVFIKETKEVPHELDFRRFSKLGTKLNYLEKHSFLKTIDNTFIFDKIIENKPQAVLRSPDIQLKLYTSYPALNIYVDNSNTPVIFNNNKDMKLRRGIALEPQLYNLDLDSLRINKGDKYKHFILYKFKKLH